MDEKQKGGALGFGLGLHAGDQGEGQALRRLIVLQSLPLSKAPVQAVRARSAERGVDPAGGREGEESVVEVGILAQAQRQLLDGVQPEVLVAQAEPAPSKTK